MPARVLVIGLDAAESTLIEKWADEGLLPNIQRIRRAGASFRLDNPMETLPGGIWPEICMGRKSGKTGLFYHPEQIHTGEAQLRPVEYNEIDPTVNYWSIASDAGRRVCVLDQVQSSLNTELNGIQVLEWGLHDRTYAERSHPAGLLEEIHGRYGLHPVRNCDHYPDSVAGRTKLLQDLKTGVIKKRALALDLMARESWDLYACSLGESHCVGHHFWHNLATAGPTNDPANPVEHQNAIREIYQGIDETVGHLIDAAGSEATTLIIASHGIGPSRAGYQLLPEILARLGMSSDRTTSRGPSALRRLQYFVKSSVPRRMIPLLRILAGLGPIKAIQRGKGALRFPLESAMTRAIAVPNNRVGAIRLNVKGRDPFGCVEPGSEVQALISELRTALLELTDPDTGKPIISRIEVSNDLFGKECHPDVPDMLIVYRPGTEAIEACQSERVGTIEVPYFMPRTHRSGDHTVESRLWVAGPSIGKRRKISQAHVLDFAPTVLSLLDVPLPGGFDGRPIALGSG